MLRAEVNASAVKRATSEAALRAEVTLLRADMNASFGRHRDTSEAALQAEVRALRTAFNASEQLRAVSQAALQDEIDLLRAHVNGSFGQ